MGILRNLFIRSGSAAKQESPDAADAGTSPADGRGSAISASLRHLQAFMEGVVESLAIERIEELTLREVISRFVQEQKSLIGPARGALIVRPHREGKLVLWAFLNADNSLVCGEDGQPFGGKAICTRLDDELTSMLKGKELLIVE